MTVDTRLQNLNIWEGTLNQIEGASIGANDLAFATDVSFEDKFRYQVMPVASAEWLGKIVQYTGATNANYMSGSFYKCVSESERIDYVSGSGFILTMTDPETFASVCDWAETATHRTLNYWEFTIGSSQSSNSYQALAYDYNNNFISVSRSGGLGSDFEEYWGMTYSGQMSADVIVRVYKAQEPKWVLVENTVAFTSVDFENVTGDPYSNVPLKNALLSSAIQVTSLPEITEETKDKIYQYIGADDTEAGLYRGTFYQAIGYTWEIDTANSQLIQDMSFTVRNEANFWNFFDVFDEYPQIEHETYLDVVFYGRNDVNDGYSTSWWLDPTVEDIRYYSGTQRGCSLDCNVDFGGTPVINNTSDSSRDTVNTRFRLVLRKNLALDAYKWTPINLYPKFVVGTNQAFMNKSHHTTSLIERRSGDNWQSDGDYNTVIGVGSNGNSSGYSTVYGADNWGNYLSTVVGAHNRTVASASIVIGANTRGTSGEYGICIGVDSGAGQRALAIGPSAQSYFRSIALGQNANASQSYDIAIGDTTTASGTWSLAIGNEARSTEYAAIALGHRAKANAQYAVQICEGTNASTGTLQFRNYQLVGNDGIIPYTRLTSTTPQNSYVLSYDSSSDSVVWSNIVPEIPVIQEEEMPEAEEGRLVQYIGESDGTYTKGYFYEAVYNNYEAYWYWRQIDVQPTTSTATDYDDLIDKPSINGVTLAGDLDPVTDLNFKRVAITGSYADLTTKPGINGHPLLANTTAADLEISYNDLIDKPADPTTQLPELPADKNEKDYMLKWDHTQSKLIWIESIDEKEDLGEL